MSSSCIDGVAELTASMCAPRFHRRHPAAGVLARGGDCRTEVGPAVDEKLGMTVPLLLLGRADEVIE